MAKAVGADYTVLVKSTDSQEVARQIEEVMGQKPEITIECSGAPPSIQTAIYVSCPKCLLLKNTGSVIKITMNKIKYFSVNLVGISDGKWLNRNEY